MACHLNSCVGMLLYSKAPTGAATCMASSHYQSLRSRSRCKLKAYPIPSVPSTRVQMETKSWRFSIFQLFISISFQENRKTMPKSQFWVYLTARDTVSEDWIQFSNFLFYIFSMENWNDKHDTDPKPLIFELMIKKPNNNRWSAPSFKPPTVLFVFPCKYATWLQATHAEVIKGVSTLLENKSSRDIFHKHIQFLMQ